MAKLTRSGIAYNLEDSPHELTVEYVGAKITFVFSSDLYRRLFLDRCAKNREDINASLSNRFGFAIANDILSDIKLYLAVEKRGFLIFANGEEMHSPDEVLLDGYTISKKDPSSEASPELEKLDALKTAGIITSEEYEMMKARIR